MESELDILPEMKSSSESIVVKKGETAKFPCKATVIMKKTDVLPPQKITLIFRTLLNWSGYGREMMEMSFLPAMSKFLGKTIIIWTAKKIPLWL